MTIYLLMLVPTLATTPWGLRLGWGRILFIWIATTAIMATLIEQGSRDLPVYLVNYAEESSLPFSQLSWQDPLYLTGLWLWAKAGGGGLAFYVGLSSLAILLKLTAFRRLTEYGTVAALLYMCSYFFLHEFTQIRAALAIAIWLHAIASFPKSRTHFTLLTLLACTIHLQAVFGFLVWPLASLIRTGRGRIALAGVTLVIMLLAPTRVFDAIGFGLIGQIPDVRAAIYLAFAEQGAFGRPNPFSVISLLSFLVASFGLLRLIPFDAHEMRLDQNIVYACLFAGSAALSMLAAVAVGAFRVSEHFFALLPIAISNLIYQCRSRSIALISVPILAILLAYIFVYYSSILVDPITGVPDE